MTGALRVGILTFFLTISVSVLFQLAQAWTAFWVSVLVLLAVVFLGIIFDIVGTASTAATEKPFHAMASDRVPGARKGVELVRKADQVANFCNDVVGDICGTVSGSIGAALVINFVANHDLMAYRNLISLVVVGLISALTVGGKAAGKAFAIRNPTMILLYVAFLLEKVEVLLGRRPERGKNRKIKNKTSK